MEHIRLFELNEDYLNALNFLPYPCISYIKDTQEVKYEKQQSISVNYRITQDIIDTCSSNGLNEIELYSNSVGSVNSYILNGESYSFESPLYESIEKTVEYDVIESYYTPSDDSYIHSDNVTLNTLFSTEDDVNLSDYYIYIHFLSDDLKSFRLNEFAYNKLKNEYEYLFVCYREKSIDIDGIKFNELPQVKTYVTYENGDSDEFKFEHQKEFHFHSLESLCSIKGDMFPSNSNFTLYVNGEVLYDLVIPYTITKINNYAFRFCSGLHSVTFGNSLLETGYASFQGCINLKNVIISNSIQTISSGSFKRCSNLTSVTIGESVTTIESYAFSECANLSSITIPASVTSIENYVFGGCGNLSTITFQSVIAPTLESANPFVECNVYGTLYYPQGSDYSSITSKLPSGWTYEEI